MDPAFREALAALRALSDPTRAFGANKARGMQAFAAAAAERVLQLHSDDYDPTPYENPYPDYPGPVAA